MPKVARIAGSRHGPGPVWVRMPRPHTAGEREGGVEAGMRTTNVSEVPVLAEVRRRGLGASIGAVTKRFIKADGTSHTRALGYQGTFALLSGFIGLVGLQGAWGLASFGGKRGAR